MRSYSFSTLGVTFLKTTESLILSLHCLEPLAFPLPKNFRGLFLGAIIGLESGIGTVGGRLVDRHEVGMERMWAAATFYGHTRIKVPARSQEAAGQRHLRGVHRVDSRAMEWAPGQGGEGARNRASGQSRVVPSPGGAAVAASSSMAGEARIEWGRQGEGRSDVGCESAIRGC